MNVEIDVSSDLPLVYARITISHAVQAAIQGRAGDTGKAWMPMAAGFRYRIPSRAGFQPGGQKSSSTTFGFQCGVVGRRLAWSRLADLWQMPLLLLSVGLFAAAAWLFIDPKPGPLDRSEDRIGRAPDRAGPPRGGDRATQSSFVQGKAGEGSGGRNTSFAGRGAGSWAEAEEAEHS